MTKTFVHLGCGPAHDRIPTEFVGWTEIRVDSDPAVLPDVVSSMTRVDLPDAAADGVYCCHSLEHLERWEVPVALAEMLRLLRPGGVAMILTPDLEAWARDIVMNPSLLEVPRLHPAHGPISVLDALFGPGLEVEAGNDHQRHRTAFTSDSLYVRLVQAGFQEIVFNNVLWQIVVTATKPISLKQEIAY